MHAGVRVLLITELHYLQRVTGGEAAVARSRVKVNAESKVKENIFETGSLGACK